MNDFNLTTARSIQRNIQKDDRETLTVVSLFSLA